MVYANEIVTRSKSKSVTRNKKIFLTQDEKQPNPHNHQHNYSSKKIFISNDMRQKSKLNEVENINQQNTMGNLAQNFQKEKNEKERQKEVLKYHECPQSTRQLQPTSPVNMKGLNSTTTIKQEQNTYDNYNALRI